MTKEEAINRFKEIRKSFSISIAQSKFYPSKDILDELCDMAIEALSEPTVIRSKTLMPTKDFKGWAKRVRENNPSVIVIPCDAEVVSADRPAGEWVRSGNTLICPICGAKGEDIKDDYCFNYCPNCGADMRPKLKRKEADVVTIDESI